METLNAAGPLSFQVAAHLQQQAAPRLLAASSHRACSPAAMGAAAVVLVWGLQPWDCHWQELCGRKVGEAEAVVAGTRRLVYFF